MSGYYVGRSHWGLCTVLQNKIRLGFRRVLFLLLFKIRIALPHGVICPAIINRSMSDIAL